MITEVVLLAICTFMKVPELYFFEVSVVVIAL